MSCLGDFKLGDRLGRGSYGSVYECKDKNGKSKAIKCIPMKGKYRHVLEASIMATYKHPNIASSDSIFIENDTLYIVQKIAKNDLAVLTRNNPLPLRKVKEYIYNITKAIHFLHARRIVHGDIKAANVLMYDDGTIKLTDFSLSVIMLKKYYNNGIGTQSHKPPESFNKDNWSYPVDIWALGCTIYELTYGRNIFPKQTEKQGYSTSDLTCISLLDWISTTENIKLNTTLSGRKLSLASVDFEKVKHPQRYYNAEYREMNKFILSLMRRDPKDRLTTKEILTHPYLSDVNVIDNPKIIKKHRKSPITAQDIMLIDRYRISEPQRTISLEILSICYGVPDMSMSEICRSCIYISYVLTKTIIPCKFSDCTPIKLLSHMGYSFHEVTSCV